MTNQGVAGTFDDDDHDYNTFRLKQKNEYSDE
jgi:hypothetical protein